MREIDTFRMSVLGVYCVLRRVPEQLGRRLNLALKVAMYDLLRLSER